MANRHGIANIINPDCYLYYMESRSNVLKENKMSMNKLEEKISLNLATNFCTYSEYNSLKERIDYLEKQYKTLISNLEQDLVLRTTLEKSLDIKTTDNKVHRFHCAHCGKSTIVEI
jgi:hypothetical protein